LALVYAALGDQDRAIENLQKAADDRESQVLYLGLDAPGSSLGPLRKDSRFVALVHRIGLPQ
jgi:hypothetical protein